VKNRRGTAKRHAMSAEFAAQCSAADVSAVEVGQQCRQRRDVFSAPEKIMPVSDLLLWQECQRLIIAHRTGRQPCPDDIPVPTRACGSFGRCSGADRKSSLSQPHRRQKSNERRSSPSSILKLVVTEAGWALIPTAAQAVVRAYTTIAYNTFI